MKAIWAFEPFHQDNERIKGMYRLLSALATSPEEIEVGYVVTSPQNDLNTTQILSAKQRAAANPLQNIIAAVKKANLKITESNIHIVDYAPRSVTQVVDRFLQLAAKRKAGVIGLYTHARSGFKRFLLGSFAETTIHRSKTSLLVVNPLCQIPQRIKSVVFATEFRPADRKHLVQIIKLCQKMNANLTVLHHAEVIYGWSLDESNPKFHAYRKQVNNTKAAVEKACKKAGLNAEVIINSDFIGTTDLILNVTANKKADLLVMSAKAGPALALIGGSISRKVIRTAELPVLILK